MTPLQQRDLAVLWHPCAQMRDYEAFPPLEVVGAEGCWLHLTDGSRVLDVISSWWCKSLGHRHPGIRAAIGAQLDAFDHVLLANTTNEPVVRLCERLLALAGGHFANHGKVLFAESGSVAVEIALKLAIQWQAQSGRPQRTRIAGLAGGYHGETAGAMSVSDSPLYTRHYQPFLFPTRQLGPLPLRSGPGDPRWMDAAAEWPAIAAQLDADADTLAAVIVEPVLQGAGGMVLHSPDLLRRLAAWCTAHDVLLIADEVATGCHRLGPFLASSLAGVSPDLVILGKGLTGGASPLAVVLATDAIASRFLADWGEQRAFLHSSTFAGHALGVAAAHAALDAYAALDAETLVARRGAELRRQLAAVRHPRLGPVRGAGMLAAVDLLGCDPAARTGYRVYRAAVARGVLLRPLGDTLYLLPPYAISDDEIAHACRVLGEAVAATLDG